MSRPPIPDPPYEGGCLCGGVRYRLEGGLLGVNACHCADCKKLTGADYLKMLVAERALFTRERGETHTFRKRADSGREIDIVRCAACGVRLWHEPLSAPHLIFVAAGTLDDPSWAQPASHIYVEQAAIPEGAFAPDALRVTGQPQERSILFEAFQRIYGR